jgi:hypothetical protein
MTWRRFQWLLCAAMAVIALLRLLTGNLLGALIPAILAVIFAALAADVPILQRAKQLWGAVRRRP